MGGRGPEQGKWTGAVLLAQMKGAGDPEPDEGGSEATEREGVKFQVGSGLKDGSDVEGRRTSYDVDSGLLVMMGKLESPCEEASGT